MSWNDIVFDWVQIRTKWGTLWSCINMYIYLYPKSASVILLLPKNKYAKPFYGLIMISLCLSWLRGGGANLTLFDQCYKVPVQYFPSAFEERRRFQVWSNDNKSCKYEEGSSIPGRANKQTSKVSLSVILSPSTWEDWVSLLSANTVM